MRASGANPDDYVLINTTRLDELLTRIGEGHNGVLTEKDSLKKAFESQANFMEAVLKDAQKDGVGGKWVAIHNKDWEQVNYHIVEASKRSRMAKALFDMPKAFASRILLAPNISWQQFQIYANASLAAVAGTGPRAWLEAVRKYKSWDNDTRAAFDWATGVQTHALDIATMDKYLYDFYHKTLTKIPGYQRFLEGRNFLDMFFYIDAKNNQFFRRAVLYNEVKKEAYKRMAKSGASIMEIYKEKMKDTAGLESGIALQQQMNSIINDPKTMDLLASHMEDFLGDYLNFSVMERRVFQRSVMFYGFLRHSLQFTLWNLPVKHPVRTSILAMLSAAAVEDAKATLGADDLDVRQLGVFYLKGPVKIPGLGTVMPGPSGLTEINLSRASITGNMLLEALASDNPIVQGSNLVPIFNNPIWRPWIEAAIGESLYKGTPIRGNVPGEDLGDPNFKWTLGGSLGLWGSAQYVSKQYLNLIRPYRILSQAMQQYPSWRESDLSNPVFGNEYPYKYSQSPQADAYKQAIKDREAFLQNKEGGLFGNTPLAGELFPFFPQPSDTPELLQFQAEQEQLQKEADKRLKAPIEGTPWWQVGDITKDIHKRTKARKLGSFSFFGN
jgi:hypothetical protein